MQTNTSAEAPAPRHQIFAKRIVDQVEQTAAHRALKAEVKRLIAQRENHNGIR